MQFRGRINQSIFDAAAIFATRTRQPLKLVSANDHIHSRTSAHYEDRALDFQGETLALDGLAQWLRYRGYHVLWRVPGHWGHVHAEQEKQ